MDKKYKYLAFISYKREDEKWAKWLQHKLENYKLPISVRETTPSLPERVRPIFRDSTDMTGGILEKELKKGLDSSKYLIVVCSPRAAQSKWVCKEVQEFIDSGREKYIIPFIIAGEPHSQIVENECFPENMRKLSGSRELLGININEGGQNLAAIKIIAHILDLRLDTLWERWAHENKIRRLLIISLTLLGILISLAVAGTMFVQKRNIQKNLARAVANHAEQLIEEGDSYLARKLLVEVLPDENDIFSYPYIAEAEAAMRKANMSNSGIFKGHTSRVILATFSPNGKSVISCSSEDDVFRIWNVYSGVCLKEFIQNPGSSIKSIDYADDGWCLASISEGENIIKLWSGETGKCIKEFKVQNDVSFIWFCADNEHLCTKHNDGTVRLWDVYKGFCIMELTGYYYISDIDISHNEKYVAFSYQHDRNEEVYIDLYSIETNETLRTFRGNNKSVSNKIRFGNNGEYIIHEYDNTLKILSVENGDCIRTFNNVEFNYDYNMFSSYGKHIVLTYENEKSQVWDMYNGNCIIELNDYIESASISGDGKYILIDDTIYSVETGRIIKDFNIKNCIASTFSPNGQCAIFASNDKKVYFHDFSTNKDECIVKHIDNINFNADHSWAWVSSDGKYSVYPSDNRVHLVDNIEENTIMLFGHEGEIMSTTFSSDGEFVVSTSYDGTIRIWSVKNRECVKILYTDETYYASFSSDGKYLVSISINDIINIWHVESKKCVHTIKFTPREEYYESEDEDIVLYIESISFSPDDKYITLVYNDGMIYQWYYPPLQKLIDETKKQFKDAPLTPEERVEHYLN